MRQVWIPRIGGPEVLQLREAADPEPKRGEVRIRVRAAGVNFADILARMGLYPDAPRLPAVVGYEVAGEVDRLGPEVEGLDVGQRVVALTRFGGYSDQICVSAKQLLPVPEGRSFVEAAAIPVNYITAWTMLVHLGHVQAGDRVLVHACAGGVGLAAVQICRTRGAEVIGTASASKHERLRQMGVAHCIDYRTQDFEREVMRITGDVGVSVILDAVGGESFRKSYRCLEHLGRLYLFGVSSLAPGRKRSVVHAVRALLRMPRFKPVDLMQQNRGVQGVNIGHLWHRAELMQGMLRRILEQVQEGTLSPVVDSTFPLEQAAQAHEHLQSRSSFGKVVLTA